MRALGAGWLLVIVAMPVSAQWWDPARGANTLLVSGGYSREHIARAGQEIRRALAAGDIDKVERMHEEFLGLQKAGGRGRFMMSSFSGVVRDAARDPAKFAATLERWRLEHPGSLLPAVLESEALENSAWNHRGQSYAYKVSPEAMALFRAGMERAARVLQSVPPPRRTTPLYYSQAMAIAGASGHPREVVDAIFDEGVAKFPIDWEIHSTRLRFLLPQWGGSFAEMDRFIRGSVVRTQASEGTGMYARLWASIATSMTDQRDFFGQTGVSWPVLRHAFEDALTLDGYMPLRNVYATFACMARDGDTLRRQARILGERAQYRHGRFVSPDACEEMARGES